MDWIILKLFHENRLLKRQVIEKTGYCEDRLLKRQVIVKTG